MEKGTYQLKTEFFKELGIPVTQWERRKSELLEWLKNFYEYEIVDTKPLLIRITYVYGDYKKLPRKIRKITNEQAIKDYEEFTIQALGTEYKPNSKRKIAREAIAAFGFEKYEHFCDESIARRYISKPFNENAITNDKSIWVDYKTYEPLEPELKNLWLEILKENKIAEKQAAEAFYKQAKGEDISKEIGYYKKALNQFEMRTGIIPVNVREWKLNNERNW